MHGEAGEGDLVVQGLHVRTMGAGTPVLLIHGLGSSHHIWDLVAPMLARNHLVVMPDLRGHGQSHQPPSGYDFITITDEITSVMDALGLDMPAVVGHSWGAQVALALAARYPDRVSHLLMVDGGFIDFRVLPDHSWEKIRQDLMPATFRVPVHEFVHLMTFYYGDEWRPAWEPIVLGHMQVQDGMVQPRLPKVHHLAIVRAMWENDPRLQYDAVRVPAVYVVADQQGPGTLDWHCLRRYALPLAEAALSNVRVIKLSATIHDIPLQRPAVLTTIIEETISGRATDSRAG